MRGVTKTVNVDKTGDIFSNSTQELVFIIAISIAAICVICCCIICCDYFINHIKSSKEIDISQIMNKADAIPEGVNKNKRNMDDEYLQNNDGREGIEIVNEAEQSDKDDELYNNDNIAPTPERMTNKCDHSDEYNAEGDLKRIEYEYNDNIHNERKKGLFENIAESQQETTATNGITNKTATDGADDPGFV